MKKKRSNVVRYNRWGYIFLIPFVVVFVVFQLIPLINTIYYSFFEYYRAGLKIVGPNFVGLKNFIKLFSDSQIWKYTGNTLIIWIIGFIPQIIVSLLLAAWFSDPSLRLKAQRFFKTVIYLPNLIMAAAFAMLFFLMFSNSGPINSMLVSAGILDKPYPFLDRVWSTRFIIAFMNFMMWFGNTTILLMAGMMNIDTSLFEAAEVDGATSTQIFFRITLPILKPILLYVMITSLIGGLQMFDVPQILTGDASPANTSRTLIMYLNNNLYSKNYGMGGSISVYLFVVTSVLSFVVFKFTNAKKK